MKLHVDIEKDLHSFRLKVSFDTDGEVFAVLGSSGSGKSMTLKCIAGIEKPDRGVVTLGGRVLFDSAAGIDLPPQKRRIGYLFQDHALFPHMTVMENISCGSEKNAREYIDRFYLRGKEDLRPHQLSGGEKQRTAIARMLAAEPKLIMLDDPCQLWTVILNPVWKKNWSGPSDSAEARHCWYPTTGKRYTGFQTG